jgi:hypothetical protein
MNTTAAFGSSYQGSSDRKILLHFQPAIRKTPEPESNIVRFPSAGIHPELAEARVPEPAIWERLELALVAILALAVIVSVILFFAAAGGSA